MKGNFEIRLAVLCFTVSITSPIFAQDPMPRQQPVQPQTQSPNRDHIKTFAGKIAKNNGKYVLQDFGSANSYALDDQKAAGKYAGKVVLVTGILDSTTNTIHVKKIDAAV